MEDFGSPFYSESQKSSIVVRFREFCCKFYPSTGYFSGGL